MFKENNRYRVAVIGAGFSGLASSASLALNGVEVDVFEKNSQPGGRARNFKAAGFTFDMGPSWYWLPDVFERFFDRFGYSVSDLYDLKRIDPSYRMFFGRNDFHDVPADIPGIYELFELLEPGSSKKLKKFLDDAEYKYNLGVKSVIFKPGLNFFEFVDYRLMKGIYRLDFFRSMTSYIGTTFKNPKLRRILEFPVLFLGSAPSSTPALYSLMNYADMVLGTWYPMGGFYKVIESLVKLNNELGVRIHLSQPVNQLDFTGKSISGIRTSDSFYSSNAVVGSADYEFIERELVPENLQTYSPSYWNGRKMAPSALLFYIGLNKKLKNLIHHNLLFDEDFEKHASEIYEYPQWPKSPAMYISVSSKTDPSVAPQGCENLVVLIPVASGLVDTDEIRSAYYEKVITRLEYITGEPIRDFVVFKRSYAHHDFERDYNAFKGNAYGLANTLSQTAFLKPKMRSRKIKNLFYCGQLTSPGPGVPPSIISGEVAAGLVLKYLKH